MIVDAHCHIVAQIRGRIGRGRVHDIGAGRVRLDDGTIIEVMPTEAAAIQFTVDDLLGSMEQAGVARAVLLQGPFYGEANDEVAGAVRQYPGQLCGAAYFDPWDGDGPTAFTRVTRELGLTCIKLEVSQDFGLMGLHPELDLGAPELDWLWGACQQHGIVLALDLGQLDGPAYQLAALERLAVEYPRLRIVIPHLGNPRQGMEHDAERLTRWNHLLRMVREHPNLAMDLAALPHRCTDAYPFAPVRGWIEHAVAQVGADRLMWGTDIPGLFSVGSYRQLLELGRLHLAGLIPRDQEAILGETALSVYW
jgi:predicted TIM-barrel fold metal-dependent hydrolase